MTNFVLSNNAQTTLASAASSSDTTLVLTSATGFPSSIPAGFVFPVTLNDAATRQIFEICYCTAISGTSLTVERGQEGTTAQSWGVGDLALVMATAGVLTALAEGNGFLIGSAQIVGEARGLSGSSAGSVKTASWTVQELIAETALGGVCYKGTSLSLSFNGANTGAGGMDTGSMPTSADLSIYAIYNPATNTWNVLGCAGSTSNGPIYTGSNMPSGYTASALIWAGVTDSSGDIKTFIQSGRKIEIALVEVLTIGTATTWTSISISTVVPACAVASAGVLLSNGYSSGNTAGVASDSNGTGFQQAASPSNTNVSVGGIFTDLALATAQTIYYENSTSGGSMDVWISSYSI